MKILVMGYFGAANSGDDAVLSGIVNLVDKCTGATNTYFIMSSHNGPPRDVGKYIKNPYEFVWYDKIPAKIDLVVVATAQPMSGFFINPVLMAMHKGIPVIATCIKMGMTDSPVFKEVYTPIISRLKVAFARLRKNYDSWKEQGFNNVEYGSDFAVYNEPEECAINDYDNSIIICPRRSSNEIDEVSNDFQVWWITNFIRAHNSERYVVMPFSEGDAEMCELLKMYKSLTVLDIKHYEFKKVMGIFKRAKMVVSTGRLHAMIYALMAGKPVFLASNLKAVSVRIPERGSDPDRFHAFAFDFKIPVYDGVPQWNTIDESTKGIDFALIQQLKVSTENRMKEVLDSLFNKGTR